MAARKPSLRESYGLLGLPESANEEEVRKSYKLRARECHPDKHPNDPEATRKFQELGEAYHRIQSRKNEDEDDFPDDIDPFAVFVQVMRMQQFMRNIFRAQFSDSEDEDDLAFRFAGRPFRPFDPFDSLFNFSQAREFEHRRSRHPDQSGYSRFHSSSWRYNQQSRSREEPSFRRANMSAGTEGFPRANKQKNHPRRRYDDEPRQPKEPYGREERSTESSGDKTSFTDVKQDTSFPVHKPKARPKPFPQVKPKQKSKKQQRYEEWRRQEEVTKDLGKEEIKEGEKEGEASSVNTAEQVFRENEDISQNGGPPADPASASEKQNAGIAGDGDAVVTDKGNPQKENSDETPTQGTSLGSQKNLPRHYGKVDTPSCEQTRNYRCHNARAEGDKVGKDKQTKLQTQNESHKEKQRRTPAVINEDLNDIEMRGKLQERSKPSGKAGVTGPGAIGQNQRKNRNRQIKKAKGIAREEELTPELSRRTENDNETRACRDKTQVGEQQEFGQIYAGEGDATLSAGESQRRRNPKKKAGMDAEKPIKMTQNETGKQEKTEEPGNNVNTISNAKIHERKPSSSQPEEDDSFGKVRFGLNKDGQVKSASRSDGGEAKYSKADQSKPRKTNYKVHEFPNSPTYQTYSKRKDHDYRNGQKSPKEKANEGRGSMATPQQQFKAAPKPEKDHVYGPQAYRKPPIENNHYDNSQWRTGNKRKARRERKWSRSPTCTGQSVRPETDFWDSVMAPTERSSDGFVAPIDELEEQRQLEIALELSKRQF